MNKLTWHKDAKANFGDDLNPYLYEKIVGKAPMYIPLNNGGERFMAIGSIISAANTGTIVWGSGAMFDNNRLSGQPIIKAVRGPLTRNIVIASGIKCPEVYGDPALLLPRYYNPKTEKKYKVGLIPHYVDHNTIDIKEDNTAIKISIGTNIEEFINVVTSCECIVSSSLHGLIIADAYGIPCRWAEMSSNVAGNGFKFKDYFQSIGVTPYAALNLRDVKVVESSTLINSINPYKVNIDLNKLMTACPFHRK